MTEYGKIEGVSYAKGYVKLYPPYAKYTLVLQCTDYGVYTPDILYQGDNKTDLETAIAKNIKSVGTHGSYTQIMRQYDNGILVKEW
jgi:hypothetical protein